MSLSTILDSDVAATSAAGVVAVFGLFKLILKLRQDGREDRTDGVNSKAHDGLVKNQAAEISRLYTMVREVGARLDEEIAQRRRVEAENMDLTLRLSAAERQLVAALARIRELEAKAA